MPGILDIAPPEIVTERFEIRGGSIEVRALRNRELAILRHRFPALDQAAGETLPELEMVELINDVAPAMIAAAAGQLGDEDIEAAVAERLTEAELSEIFSAIMRLTNPPSPLAGSPVAAGQGGNDKATISPRAS